VYRYRASRNPEPSKVTHHTLLEIIWTLIPVLVLIVIGIPSIKLLYFADKVEKADMTIVAVGHQWYWTYEYPDEEVEFESYMIKDEDIKPGQYRLLSVDNPVYIPVGATVKVLVKSEDVIHSFAIPAFGMKLDAVPGRTNETWFRVDKEGRYYGQCSELCGKDHGYMPIEINVVSKENYQGWLKQNNAKSTRPKPKIIETKATIDTANNPTESNNVAEATSTKQAATTKNSNAPIKGVDSTKQEVISKSGKKAG
jgi:cytochrome c oxidase subunit 2